MLFNKVVAISAVAGLATATAVTRDGPSNQCCQQVQTVAQANSSGLSALLSLLGIVLGDTTSLIGLNCSPITIIGGGNGGCNTNTVNCQGTAVGGLINIGCIPIQI
ncbi:fungal hydrophobin [Marasmius fiardii PR-910]|nr:fungal hydrophobin [Marasmius fiardii PR-910]KAF9256171.1 fungal hydrophobin [Marasmius fiardii PR-910]